MVSPSPVHGAPDNASGWLLVANKGDHTLSVIDPVAARQVRAIDVGEVTGHEIATSPDGRLAYVPIYGNSGVGRPGTDGSTLSVIDIRAGKVAGRVDFGHGVRPHCVEVGPKDRLLYVSTELDQAITVIDPHSLKIVAKIPTGAAESHMFAISHDGRRAYTANVGPGSVSVLDLDARKLITTISVAPRIQRIVLSRDSRFLYTTDQSAPQLAVIATETNTVVGFIPLPAIGYGGVATPDDRHLIVPLRIGNRVAVVEVASRKVTHTIDVPASPQEVLIPPSGGVAYISCDSSQKVAVIRLSDWRVEKLIDAGPSADGLGWAAVK